jgi:hypothetical protein
MIETRREGWPPHGVEALVALYAAREARIEPWFGEPVADGDRVAVDWRVVVEEDGARSPSRTRRCCASAVTVRCVCSCGPARAGQARVRGRRRELRIEPSEILRLLEIQPTPPVGFKTAFCLQIRISRLAN